MLKTAAYEKIKKLKKRVRAVAGGTAAGKTIAILMWLTVLAQWDTKPTLTSVVSETFPHLRRGAMRDFLNILEEQNDFYEDEWDKTNSIYTLPGGSMIEFFSADQPSKVRGPRRDRLFVNEANLIPHETVDQLLVRTNEFAYFDWNPTAEFWFEEYFEGRDDVDFIRLTYQDNEALAPAIIKEIERHRDQPNWWRVFGMGLLGEMENKIYSNWRRIPEIPHEARLIRYGLDFGYSQDPTALIAIYYYNGGYILDEILYQIGLSNKQIADVLKTFPPAVVVADSAEPKSIAEMRLYGISIIPANKGKGSVSQGIRYVQAQRISYTAQSVNLEKEFRNYTWKKDKITGAILDEPIDIWNHALDATRYGFEKEQPLKPARIIEQRPYESPSIEDIHPLGDRRVSPQRKLHRAVEYEGPGVE